MNEAFESDTLLLCILFISNHNKSINIVGQDCCAYCACEQSIFENLCGTLLVPIVLRMKAQL